MTETKPPTSDVGAQDDIELRLGASLVHLPIIRSVAASIAMRADFDLDSIADLRLAVDEACSTLITRAVPGSTMVCRFTVSEEQLLFRGAVTSSEPDAPSTASFGWRVLTTLADSAAAWADENAQNGQRNWIHIELAKRKPAFT
ncbi:ATP-binding protein [Saccharomonospora piscinae]|uniref:ATP-binding protein n=1 Tax=Saccharomonospora piscinae TaxID=687388 RepID=A0A1V9A274_SACPI|nr:ATP-binding protein [Saccharomonospora piscinae]OQO91237.1 ATP-binding protein [Saccharomonospora piscinae]TLW93543.1 ATP-binding protein [Saccharomonospora piscinae]